MREGICTLGTGLSYVRTMGSLADKSRNSASSSSYYCRTVILVCCAHNETPSGSDYC